MSPTTPPVEERARAIPLVEERACERLETNRAPRLARWTIFVGAAAALTLGLARRLLLVITVDGASMLPTCTDGDRVLALRTPPGRRPRPGDVVVVRAPADAGGHLVVKRVVAATVPDDHLWVEGDDPRSTDSRHWGALPTRDVVARVVSTRRSLH